MIKKGDQKPEAVKPVGKPKTAKAVEAKTKSAVAKPKVVEKPKPAVKPKSAAKPVATAAKAKPAATAKPTPVRTDSEVAKPKAATQAPVAPMPTSSSAVAPGPLPNNQAPAPQMHRSPQPALPTPGSLAKRLKLYSQLMRLDKPIGIFLLLWPTLWSLWLAAGGLPRWDLLVIFTLGVVLMRSAGCVINDFADRKIDGQVARTKARPLATGSVSSSEALALFVVLCLLAFGLVLLTNILTIKLSIGGLLLAFCYPFMKRHTHLPQVVLGAAFAWSIPMAFAAQSGALGQEMWLIYLAVVLWTVVYDTFYAMVDRDDDKRIGVKSTAILFGEQDRFITGFLQLLTIYALVLVGGRFELGSIYYASLVVAAGLFVYQQYLIRFREREPCFRAFLNNHWVGMVVFIGIVADLALKTPH